jgi:hypothetical protein
VRPFGCGLITRVAKSKGKCLTYSSVPSDRASLIATRHRTAVQIRQYSTAQLTVYSEERE